MDRTRTRLSLAVTLLALVATVLSVVVTAALYRADLRSARDLAAHRHQVTATTLVAAPAGNVWLEGTPQARIPASWQYPAGRTHTGQLPVPAGTARGAAVATWVDDSGALASLPRSGTDLATSAALTGLAMASGSAVLCGTVLGLGRRRIDQRLAVAWEQEWEQVEPRWSGRSRSA
ncbi:hypothetical protein [Peterkaempfera sp. SMS 1(5)a]